MYIDYMTWRKTSHSNGGECVEVGMWRKASYSTNNNGSECVEVGVWRKASYSTGNGGECVEVASARPAAIAVRDSKNPCGPSLAFAPHGWDQFLTEVKAGAYNLS